MTSNYVNKIALILLQILFEKIYVHCLGIHICKILIALYNYWQFYTLTHIILHILIYRTIR